MFGGVIRQGQKLSLTKTNSLLLFQFNKAWSNREGQGQRESSSYSLLHREELQREGGGEERARSQAQEGAGAETAF